MTWPKDSTDFSVFQYLEEITGDGLFEGHSALAIYDRYNNPKDLNHVSCSENVICFGNFSLQ